MSNWIILPDGNAISTIVIKSVMLYPGRGVVCRDAQQRVAAWIKVDDPAKGELLRDILIRAAKEGRIPQPNWDFMKVNGPETQVGAQLIGDPSVKAIVE